MNETNELDQVRTLRADLPALGAAAEAAARADLLAVIATTNTAPRPRWRVPALRLGVGLAGVAAAATAAALVLAPASEPAPAAAWEIKRTGDGWEIEVKDGRADLGGVFQLVGTLTAEGGPRQPAATPKDPADRGGAPMEIRIEGCGPDVPLEECDVRAVISGEVGPDTVLNGGEELAGKAGGDEPPELRGSTVAEAVAKVTGLGLGVSYAAGWLADDGTGTIDIPARPWKPSDTARVSGAYLSADDRVTLIVEEPLD
ncbi:hypothetical protein GCM10022221_55390 [Actinocorallia aurea]